MKHCSLAGCPGTYEAPRITHLMHAPPAHSLQRSTQACRDFMHQSGYLRGRPDYEIDHVVPLAGGGPDHRENMQWLSRTEQRDKDAVKRPGCR